MTQLLCMRCTYDAAWDVDRVRAQPSARLGPGFVVTDGSPINVVRQECMAALSAQRCASTLLTHCLQIQVLLPYCRGCPPGHQRTLPGQNMSPWQWTSKENTMHASMLQHLHTRARLQVDAARPTCAPEAGSVVGCEWPNIYCKSSRNASCEQVHATQSGMHATAKGSCCTWQQETRYQRNCRPEAALSFTFHADTSHF